MHPHIDRRGEERDKRSFIITFKILLRTEIIHSIFRGRQNIEYLKKGEKKTSADCYTNRNTYSTPSYRYRLQQEWNDGFTLFRVVWEFFLVVSMLTQGPHWHLVHTGKGEQTSCIIKFSLILTCQVETADGDHINYLATQRSWWWNQPSYRIRRSNSGTKRNRREWWTDLRWLEGFYALWCPAVLDFSEQDEYSNFPVHRPKSKIQTDKPEHSHFK